MKSRAEQEILIIDDDEIFHMTLEEILGKEYTLYGAKSGRDALDILGKGIKPDLILLDILMPNMDGWETFRRIRGIGLLADVPIAFLTALTGIIDEKRAKEIGAADYITKPIDSEEFLIRIGKIINSF